MQKAPREGTQTVKVQHLSRATNPEGTAPLECSVQAAVAIGRFGDAGGRLEDDVALLSQAGQRPLRTFAHTHNYGLGFTPLAIGQLLRSIEGRQCHGRELPGSYLLEEDDLRGLQAKVGVVPEKVPSCCICGCASHNIPSDRFPARRGM
jgi:hypothetical protein